MPKRRPQPHLAQTDHALRRPSGQAMTEFALVLPIFVLLIFAVVNIGLAVSSNSGLDYAVGKGVDLAEYMSITNTLTLTQTNEISAAVYAALPSYVNPAKTTVLSSFDPTTDLVSVSASYDYPLAAGGIIGTQVYHEHVSRSGPVIISPVVATSTPIVVTATPGPTNTPTNTPLPTSSPTNTPTNAPTNTPVPSMTLSESHVCTNGFKYATISLTWTLPTAPQGTTITSYAVYDADGSPTLQGTSALPNFTLSPDDHGPYAFSVTATFSDGSTSSASNTLSLPHLCQ